MPFRSPAVGSLEVSPRWWTIAAGTLADVDGLKASVATSASPVTYNLLAHFDGITGARLFNGVGPAFTISAHTSASAATYNTGASNQVVVTGQYSGATVTQRFQLSAAGGGENLITGPSGSALQPFDKIDSIAIPAQLGTGGAWTFGIRDLVGPSGLTFRYIRAQTAGNVILQYSEDPNSQDTFPLLAGETLGAQFQRVINGTALQFSVGL